jgi:hypothetical protein
MFFAILDEHAHLLSSFDPLQERYDLTEEYYSRAHAIATDESLSEDQRAAQIEELNTTIETRIQSLGSRMNTTYTATSIAAYIAPITGELMDLRNFRNAIERGQVGSALGSAFWFALGTVGDLAFGLGTATRIGRVLAKLDPLRALFRRGETAIRRAANNHGIFRRLISESSEVMRRYDRHAMKIFLGSIGLDASVRLLWTQPTLDTTHTF